MNARKFGEVMMTVSDPYRFAAHSMCRPPSGRFAEGERRLDLQGAPSHAVRLCLAGLLLCFLSLSLAAQTPREIKAQAAIDAAKEAQQRGDFAQAAAGYQAAVKLMPEVPELYGNLGIAYYLQRDYPKAIAAFQQALKRKPSLEGPNLYLGMSYIRMNRFADSIKPLQKVIAVNPKLREAYINLAGSYNELGKEEEALRVLQRAQKVLPNDEEVLYSLGTAYYDLMFKTYGKMANVAPNSYRYDQVLGKSFEARQEFSSAIVEYKQALKTNPQASGLHSALGGIYWMSGRYDEAIPEFEAELQITPQDYMTLWKLGNTYLHQHKNDKAREYLQEAIRVKPTLAQAYGDLGKLSMETKNYEQALVYLQKVVQLDPTVPNTHYLLATTFRRLGNASEAQAEMELFQKLSKAQTERRRPADAILAGADEQAKDLKPLDEDPSAEQ
jgi:tetratricopeptide (TPR) repeat protein